MPFGLCNAPATFSRSISLVLRGLSWKSVIDFLDDVIVLTFFCISILRTTSEPGRGGSPSWGDYSDW